MNSHLRTSLLVTLSSSNIHYIQSETNIDYTPQTTSPVHCYFWCVPTLFQLLAFISFFHFEVYPVRTRYFSSQLSQNHTNSVLEYIYIYIHRYVLKNGYIIFPNFWSLFLPLILRKAYIINTAFSLFSPSFKVFTYRKGKSQFCDHRWGEM